MRRIPFAALVASVALTACHAATPPPHAGIGVFSSLPLLWEESDNVGDLIGGGAKRPWSAKAIAQAGKVIAIDRLDRVPEGVSVLILAQPRPLAPDENVALDDWVRGGGRVLLFADPMLSAHSRFALGDRRRPQDVAMLSPILTRWGLRLDFDEAQDPAQRVGIVAGVAVPVALSGTFVATGKDCTVADSGLSARCRIGKGAVLAIADAALLEAGDGTDTAARTTALIALIDQAAR